MTLTHQKTICQGYEPIPGYVLEEMIGRGGFGEVWRSTAPGGLKKAIKFVFGNQGQSRALRELRSLERVKGVHHPFLLTLERFEIVDEQLTIITELADGSLEEVYKTHRENGSCGIPRELLLSHLHDTADGLDYLHQSFQLQHLDIKPGNLLIIGGHVKVADFGLLKDLRDIDCSVVGGLTPLYAPPEVFDGRPSLHSDQYSLAVMFQELLTGTRPFSGRTIAQLATQHVHSAPNLEALPPSDRPVVARALEKDPNRRFPSCKEFVEALRNRHGRGSVAGGRSEAIVNQADDPQHDVATDGIAVEDLPQIADRPSPSAVAANHALVVALGGSGGECVRELRRRIAELRVASPLHLQSVVIDTDMSTIHSIRLGEASDRVPHCNAVYAPLRTAHEYRNSGTDRLRSISRRWIYNVPRSGSTEGMRPLGRLAIVDHGAMIKEKLTQSIDSLVQQCGGVAPRVYIVGSLSGGSGSGMYIDIAHLLRHLLDQAGLEETRILSLLSSVAFQADPSNPLALHDTQAALNEIEFFMQVGNGYPGDEGAGWPSVPAARTPLKDLYLIAASPRDHFAPNPIATIIEYLWADASGCGHLLTAARRIEGAEEQKVRLPAIRSVGVIPLGDRHRFETRILAPSLVGELLGRWLGIPSKARQAAPALADRLERRLSLSLAGTLETLMDHFDPTTLADATAATIDQFLAAKKQSGEFDWLSAGWLNNIYREVSVCLNDRRADVSTVFESLQLLGERMIAWRLESLQSCPTPADATTSAIENPILCDTVVKRLAAEQLHQFSESLKFLAERVERFAAILAVGIVEIKKEVGNINPWETMPPEVREQRDRALIDLHSKTVGQCLVRPLNDLGANVDTSSLVGEITETAIPVVIRVVEELSDEMARVRADVQSGDSVNLTTYPAEPSMRISRTAGTQALSVPRVADTSDGPVSIEEAVAIIKPTLLSMGGLQRLLLIVGSEVERSQMEPQLRAVHSGALTVAVIPGSDPKLIHEGQQIELRNILSRLAILNGGNDQITTRLASRVDVALS